MKILVVGSGSGGHIYPSVAFVKYLKQKNITYKLIAFKEIDKNIFDKHHLNYEYIDNDEKFKDKYKKIKKIIKNEKFDKYITFGGKNGFIAGICAKFLGLDIYISEQNVVFGKANFLLSFLANRVFLSLPIKENEKYKLVGNPVVDEVKRNKKRFFNNANPTVLLVSGSLGSKTVLEKLNEFINKNDKLNFIIILGRNCQNTYKNKDNIKVFSYYEPLSELIYNSDLVISRAGATTISEIIALNKPSILIPSPYVANNHQLKNAKYLYNLNATVIIEEKNISIEILEKSVNKILYSPFENKRMERALKQINYDNVSQKMYEEILK